MKREIFIEKSAVKSLGKIPKSDRNKIVDVIQNLANNPAPINSKKLTGREGWRIRIGNYRVIYEFNNDIVHIYNIGHRKDVYKF